MKFKTVEDLREAYPNAFKKDGSVDLTGKSEIEELPNDWHVPGTLSLRQCTGLTRLPERLNIDGALDMRRCESVSHIQVCRISQSTSALGKAWSSHAMIC